jgi:hypothetical protein
MYCSEAIRSSSSKYHAGRVHSGGTAFAHLQSERKIPAGREKIAREIKNMSRRESGRSETRDLQPEASSV